MKNTFLCLLALGFSLIDANAFGQVSYGRAVAPAPVVGHAHVHRHGNHVHVQVHRAPVPPPMVNFRIYQAAPGLIRIDRTEPNGLVTSRVMDVLELKNRLLGLRFAPPAVDAELNHILVPGVVPAGRGPIVGATETVLLTSGRLPF